MEKVTKEQMETLRELIARHKTIRYGIFDEKIYQTVENHTNRMLAIAPIIADMAGLNLNMNQMTSLILAHDLSEFGMDRDVTSMEQVEKPGAKQRKDDLEKQVIEGLVGQYGEWMQSLFDEYEMQKSETARFVKWIDKYEANRYMLEFGLCDEIYLKMFFVNTTKLIEATSKMPVLKEVTLHHLDQELKPLWEQDNKVDEFMKLQKTVQAIPDITQSCK